MAIKKSEITKLLFEEIEAIERAEKYLDKALKAGNTTFDMSVIRAFLGPGIEPNSRVLGEIIKRYREAGWNVKDVSDQRDGDYLSFS